MPANAAAPDKMPRTARGQATRRKLLDAAAQEFAENGFHAGSISAITRRAGAALGSFYTYFDSKDAIFRALVTDMSDAVRRAAREAISPEMAPLAVEREALRAAGKQHRRAMFEPQLMIFRALGPGEIVEHVLVIDDAVLENLDKRRALMRVRCLEHGGQML